MNNEIKEFAEEMEKVMSNKKNAKKRDSWKKMPINILRLMLVEEYNEWCSVRWNNPKKEKVELIDIANFCMMLFHRLKEQEVKK